MTPFAFSRAAHRHASCFCYAESPQSIVPRSPIVAATIAAAVMGAHGRHSIARDDSSVRHRPTGCSGRSFYEPGTAAGWRFSSSGRRPSGHAGTVRQCSRSTLGTLRDATTFARNPPLADLCSRTPLLSVRAVTASHRGRVNIPNVSPAPAEASRQRGKSAEGGGSKNLLPPTSGDLTTSTASSLYRHRTPGTRLFEGRLGNTYARKIVPQRGKWCGFLKDFGGAARI
jgi:hypothetical protein